MSKADWEAEAYRRERLRDPHPKKGDKVYVGIHFHSAQRWFFTEEAEAVKWLGAGDGREVYLATLAEPVKMRLVPPKPVGLTPDLPESLSP